MSQKFLKPHIKFISKTLIKQELNLSDREFDKLVSLIGLFPYIPKEKQKVDRIKDFFYRISDYEKLKTSEIYKKFKINKIKNDKKLKYTNQGLEFRAAKIKEEQYSYVDLVKSRFLSFGHAVDELGNSLTNLILSQKLRLDEEISDILCDFKNFVIEYGLLKYAFLSTNGIYYEINIKKMRVIFCSAYNGKNLEHCVEIKNDKKKKIEIEENIFSDESSSDFSEEENDILDVSLLSYNIPFQKYHLKLVLHKLKNIYENSNSNQIFEDNKNDMSLKIHNSNTIINENKKEISNKNNLFVNKKFYIDCKNLQEELKFIIEACSGQIVYDDSFDFCLGDIFETVIQNKIYLHPQYVFDCLNKNLLLNYEMYKIGKKIPKHESPFQINNFIDKNILISLSKRKRNYIQDIIDGFEDVHYKKK